MQIIQDEIKAILADIERNEDVRIFFACESGSRAWGFPSQDSDYDARFQYVRRRDWYLSLNIDRRPDVIERPISDLLDIKGWDLRKTLLLLHGSNASPLEWLQSPIVYVEKTEISAPLKQAAAACYSPKRCFHHYLSMTHTQIARRSNGEHVKLKNYFYILRPLFACKWITEHTGVVPMRFDVLVEDVVTDPSLKHEIHQLVELKRHSSEADTIVLSATLDEYIRQELNLVEGRAAQVEVRRNDIENLNGVFRDALEISWNRA